MGEGVFSDMRKRRRDVHVCACVCLYASLRWHRSKVCRTSQQLLFSWFVAYQSIWTVSSRFGSVLQFMSTFCLSVHECKVFEKVCRMIYIVGRLVAGEVPKRGAILLHISWERFLELKCNVFPMPFDII